MEVRGGMGPAFLIHIEEVVYWQLRDRAELHHLRGSMSGDGRKHVGRPCNLLSTCWESGVRGYGLVSPAHLWHQVWEPDRIILGGPGSPEVEWAPGWGGSSCSQGGTVPG